MNDLNNDTYPRTIDLVGIPDNPGCYIFSDADGKVLYIGKAKNLGKRVKSYFQKKGLDPKTGKMVGEICSVEFIVTDNEVEALILENTLIKKNNPKYNIDLKDAKSYAYIRLTDEVFPRLVVARLRDMKLKGEFFGPFVSAAARDHVMAVLSKTFKLRTCKRLPKKPCLRFHLNSCDAPCIGRINDTGYAGKIHQVRMVLKGKTRELVTHMTEEMKKASGELNFEYALELRNQIDAVKRLQEKQNMERNKKYNEDIVHYLIKNDTVYLAFFNVYKGTLENKQAFQFDYKNEEFFEEFLVRYYSENKVPKELIVPQEINDSIVSFLK
ncbi:MAG: excinuclease ABC subunit C, partial [Candidatus Aminicenantes bacterium]